MITAQEAKDKLELSKSLYLENIQGTIDLAVEGAIKNLTNTVRLNFNRPPSLENQQHIANLLKKAGFLDIRYKNFVPRQGEIGNSEYYFLFSIPF